MSALIETEIGTIAPEWKVEPLERVCEPPQYGFTASAQEQGNVRFLRITDITDSGVKWPTVPFCKCPTELLNKYRLASGDIVFARIGATTGKSYHITDPPLCVFASYLIRVRVKPDIDSEFLSQFFQSGGYWRQVDAQKNANLKKGVSGSLLKKLIVPVPPFTEQRVIAGVLGLVQRAMEQQVGLIALTTELKKALLHQLFTRGLRCESLKQTEIGPVPQSWEVVPISALGKVVTGSTPKTKVPEYYSPPEADFIAPADLGRTRLIYASEKKISMAGLETIRRLPKDAVMCVCIGSSIGKVGMTAKECSATNQQINAIVCSDRHDSAFVYYLLSYLCDYWRGFATFGPVPILSKGSFEAIKIAVPLTKEEEVEISGNLCVLDAKAEVHMRKHAALTSLFRALLHQLMTAQIRVHNLELPELA